jgi:hypothetical protein
MATALVLCGRAAISLDWPASGDLQVFLWLADLAAHGAVPYRDAVETKGPMAWLPLVPFVAAWGTPAAWMGRVVDLVFLVAGTVAVDRLARRLADRTVAALAALLFALWWSGLDWWQSAQPDAWAGAWLAAGAALAVSRRPWALVLAGAGVGAATMVKPMYLGFALVPILFAGPVSLRGGVRSAMLVGVGVVAGIAAPVGALAVLDALGPYRDALRWTASTYGAGLPGPTTLARTLIVSVESPWGLTWPLAVGGIGVLRARDRSAPQAAAIAIWLLGCLALLALQGRFWTYQGLPVLAPLAIAGSVAVITIARLPSGGARQVAVGASVVVLLVAALAPAQHGYRKLKALGSARARAVYDAREFGSYGAQPSGLAALLRPVVAGHDGALLVWAFHPGIAPLLGVPAGSRFGIMRPLYDGAGTSARDSIRALFLCELSARPPRWWVVPTATNHERREEREAWTLDSFPAAAAVLRRRYVRIAGNQDWNVFRYQDDSASGSGLARYMHSPPDCSDAWKIPADPGSDGGFGHAAKREGAA